VCSDCHKDQLQGIVTKSQGKCCRVTKKALTRKKDTLRYLQIGSKLLTEDEVETPEQSVSFVLNVLSKVSLEDVAADLFCGPRTYILLPACMERQMLEHEIDQIMLWGNTLMALISTLQAHGEGLLVYSESGGLDDTSSRIRHFYFLIPNDRGESLLCIEVSDHWVRGDLPDFDSSQKKSATTPEPTEPTASRLPEVQLNDDDCMPQLIAKIKARPRDHASIHTNSKPSNDSKRPRFKNSTKKRGIQDILGVTKLHFQ